MTVTAEAAAAKEIVLCFLRLMQDRDLDAAEALVAGNARLTFPGGKVYASQREMVAAARARYQWVKKTFDDVDASSSETGQVVYVSGTLYGVNRFGVPFAGVRYVDRFVVRDGRIVRQDVWNDLAATGALERRESA